MKVVEALWWLGVLPGIAFFFGYAEARYRAKLRRARDRQDLVVAIAAVVALQQGVLLTAGFPGDFQDREIAFDAAVNKTLKVIETRRQVTGS